MQNARMPGPSPGRARIRTFFASRARARLARRLDGQGKAVGGGCYVLDRWTGRVRFREAPFEATPRPGLGVTPGVSREP